MAGIGHPSGKVPLPPEAYAAVGDFKAAIRELKKVQAELDRKATEILAMQGKIDPALRQQINQNRSRIAYYESEDKTRRVAAEEGKKSAAKTLANLLNSHNPHGVVRNILNGTQATGTGVPNMFRTVGAAMQQYGLSSGNLKMAGLGTSLVNSAASAAGPAMLVAQAVHMIASAAEQHQEARLHNARAEAANASRSFEFVHAMRHSSQLSGADLVKRRQAINTAGMNVGDQSVMDRLQGIPGRKALGQLGFGGPVLNPTGTLISNLFDGERVGAGAVAAERKKQAMEMFDLRRKLRAIASNDVVGATSADYSGEAGVQFRATDIRSIGFKDWMINKFRSSYITTFLTYGANKLLPNYEENAVQEENHKQQLAIAKAEVHKREEYVKWWYQEPANRAIVQEHERHLHAVESFNIERSTQWNPF